MRSSQSRATPRLCKLPAMRRISLITGVLLTSLACGRTANDDGADAETGDTTDSETAETNDGNEQTDAEAEGDGDGDSGDGDGDSGDGDGDSGDGDGDSGDGDGDSGDGDGDSGDGDGDSGDGDGDGDSGDGDGDGDTGDGDGDTGDGDGDGDGDLCTDSEVACDGLDEDCNGIIDDLDEGMDGFCDCYRIGIIGTKGANPAANFEVWLEDKGTTATRFGTMANHQLTEQELDNFDILIIDRLTHTYPPEQAAILQAWIQEGHGVISMAGYTNAQIDITQQNSLATATGLSYVMPIYLDPVEVWQNHPIADGATSVQIYGGWRVSGAGEVFVRPQNEPNNSLGTATMVGEGAAIVFSDEWISFDSEWQQIPEVETFWSNMIEWVGPKNFCILPQ